MVSRNTTLVPSLGLRIGPACEAGLSAGMQRERVPPQRSKKERKKETKEGRGTYNTIRYDIVYLTCSIKLTHSQLSLSHVMNEKCTKIN